MRSQCFDRKAASRLLSVLVASVVLIFFLLLKNSTDEEHFYPDVTTRAGFACPEVNSFVSEFDPFYKWILSSSIPQVLSTTANVSIELANSYYQQARAWGVISNWTSDGNVSQLYASPEPHIAGGHMKQHRSNWLWKMQVDWGVSIRMCLSVGNGQSNRSCLWTTPVISTEKDELLALLLIGVPYRAATAPDVKPDLNNMPRTSTAFYLTNYASNAWTDFSKYQKLNVSSNYYVTDVPKCEFAPSYYSPDPMAYLAFPSIQCGCTNSSLSSTKVCMVVTRNMDTDSWGLFDYRSSCDLLTSYWAWNTGGTSFIVLVTHNTSSNKPVPFVATFNTSLGVDSLKGVTTNDLQAMANATSCVEASMQLTPEQLASKCGSSEPKLSTKDANYYLGKMRRFIWAPNPTPSPRQDNSSSSCKEDLPVGQLDFRNKLCVSMLDGDLSRKLRGKIESLLHLRDIRFKLDKKWSDDLNNRNPVYASILSALVSLVGTCFVATSKNLQDFEEWAAEFLEKSSFCNSYTGWIKQHNMFWAKFLYRAVLVLAAAALLLFTTYTSMHSVKKDRDFLQAQTVPQVLSDGTVVLFTTTATFVVEPLWLLLYLIVALTWVVIIITLFATSQVLIKKHRLQGISSIQNIRN